MTDQQAARDSGLTTEETASAGPTDRDDIQAEARSHELDRPVSRYFSDESEHTEPPAQRPRDEELHGVTTRWRDIQARFVDEPRSAVQDADALVSDLMQRLVQTLAAERHQLESHWTSGEEVHGGSSPRAAAVPLALPAAARRIGRHQRLT
jgi:hypothetical protein